MNKEISLKKDDSVETVLFGTLANEYAENPLKFLRDWNKKTVVVSGVIYEMRLDGQKAIIQMQMLGKATADFLFDISYSKIYDVKKEAALKSKAQFQKSTLMLVMRRLR